MPSILDDLAALDLLPLDDMDGGRLEEALDGEADALLVRPSDLRRCLFREIREPTGPWSGTEVETFEMLTRDGGETLVWWNSDATGIAQGIVIPEPDAAAIREAIATLFAGVGWALGNFSGTEIWNEAPDTLPRAFFRRLLEEAGARHDSVLYEDGEECDSFDAWLDANYHEER